MTEILNNRFSLTPEQTINQQAVIKVVGIGGGGSNAIDHMVTENIEGIELYVANTDAQALERSQLTNKIQFGKNLTKGLGAGSDPQVGRDAAREDPQDIISQFAGADMVFITAGMGGGTGTGAAPVFAQILKESNPDLLVVAVVTTPFEFEGSRRMSIAQDGLRHLGEVADSLITIPNDKILSSDDMTIRDAYAKANDVLKDAVQGIADLVVRSGYINVDFADVKTIMLESGATIMTMGLGRGEDRAVKAVRNALKNSLVSDERVEHAKGLLINITGDSNVTTREFRAIGDVIQEVVSENANIITGHVFDESMKDEIKVTVVATGLGEKYGISTAFEKPVIEQKQEGWSTDNSIFFTQDYDSDEDGAEDVESENEQDSAFQQQEPRDLPAVFRNSNGSYRVEGDDADSYFDR